jgi:hypothetical protein
VQQEASRPAGGGGWRRSVGGVVLAAVVIVGWLPAVAWAEPSPSPGSDQITVHPSWENAPWQAKVQTVLNVTAQAALACCVLSLLVGGAALGIGRITGSYQAGNRGVALLVGGGAGALVVATAAEAVRWLVV